MAFIEKCIRPGKLLNYQGYQYHKNLVTAKKIHWRCWRKECGARLQSNLFDIDNDNPRINILSVNKHCHLEDNDITNQNQVKNEVIAQVEADPTNPVRRVYNQSVVQNQRHGREGDNPRTCHLQQLKVHVGAHLLVRRTASPKDH